MKTETSPPSSSPELVALRKFTRDLGANPVTIWRWTRRGWLPKPINIAGRLYLTREQVAEFLRRAEAGEFAQTPKVPVPPLRPRPGTSSGGCA